jgi:Uma2 family endonuclease
MSNSTSTRAQALPDVEYPDSDGEPMSDNTLQFEWIVTLKGGLDAVFRDDPNVFVAGDLLWYPVRGDNKTRTAPDAMVVFGRPKGYRGSYKQWEEGNVAPQVVFEVLSPGNRPIDLERKFEFYERFGVEEYYQYDPDHNIFRGWTRRNQSLEPIVPGRSWSSPRLGVRFELGAELEVYGPDGKRFAPYVELARQRDQSERETEAANHARAAAERGRAAAERGRAAAERDRAAAERGRAAAEHAEETMKQEKETAQARLERLAAQLRALGIEPVE